jgi:hypothetical protein
MQKKTRKERLIWLDIMITLLTLELMSYFYYGIRSVFLAGICVVTGFVAELVSLRFMKRSFTADDLTCTSDALILALMFPAVMDYHISVIAVLFAILVAKNLFGGRLNMRGCISTAGPLAYGTPGDVRENCTQILDMMRPYGGYHFAPTHAIQDNSPTENVFTMYQTLYDVYR